MSEDIVQQQLNELFGSEGKGEYQGGDTVEILCNSRDKHVKILRVLPPMKVADKQYVSQYMIDDGSGFPTFCKHTDVKRLVKEGKRGTAEA